jgi:hypothetical protein
MRATLRTVGIVDVLSGAFAIADGSWLADELGVSAAAVRIAGAVLVLLGIDTFLLAARPVMAKVTAVVEALAALVAIDLIVMADPTGVGLGLLAATAAWCTAVAVRAAQLTRTATLVPA